MRASELDKRLARVEAVLKPKKPRLHDRLLIDGMEVTTPPGSGRFLVVPAIMGLDEWEAEASAQQDALVADARSDLNHAVAAQRPQEEVPIYLRPRSH